MKKSTIILLISATAAAMTGCKISQPGPVGDESAELTLSAENRSDLVQMEESAPLKSPDAEAQVVSKPKVVEKKPATQFTTARPELQTPDEKAHKQPKHGLRSSRKLMRFQPVRTTAYNHGEKDHVGYGRKTASGETLEYGKLRSAAADWSRYPLGTRFRIIGDMDDSEYVVNDYGSALVGTNTIDLYKPSMSAMKKWGVRPVVIEIIEWGSFKKSRSIMKGRTKYRHVRRMVESIDQYNLVSLDEPEQRIAMRGGVNGEPIQQDEVTRVVMAESGSETLEDGAVAR